MDDVKSWIRNNGRLEIGSLDEQILIAIMKPSNVSDEILSNTPNTRLLDSYVACIKGYDSQKVPLLSDCLTSFKNSLKQITRIFT